MTITDWQRETGQTLPTKEDWRVLPEPIIGQIHALPNSRGKVRVTNGILAYSELADGTLYLCHIQHLVSDKGERIVNITETMQAKPAKRVSTKANLQAAMAALLQ